MSKKFNAFEGGRRIILIIQALVMLLAAGIGIFDPPITRLQFETYGPNDPIARMLDDDECNYSDKSIAMERRDAGDNLIPVSVCFRAMEFPGGRYIPYKEADGKIFGQEEYNRDVVTYAEERVRNFPIPSGARMSYLWNAALDWIVYFFMAVGIGIATCFALMLFSSGLGFIVRGFMGIDNGSDFRTAETP
jgi:hypothetical protein